jgi:hypothetical protein
MSYWVIAQPHEDDFLILNIGTEIIGFETKEEAEDFSDSLDEPGEFVAIEYDPSMGPLIVAID